MIGIGCIALCFFQISATIVFISTLIFISEYPCRSNISVYPSLTTSVFNSLFTTLVSIFLSNLLTLHKRTSIYFIFIQKIHYKIIRISISRDYYNQILCFISILTNLILINIKF